jgi:hypothetical protein
MKCPDFFLDYEYVLFLDDDIIISMSNLDDLFKRCAINKLDLAQMALSDKSFCVWDCLYSRGRKGIRYLNCVEIMMPVLSRHALKLCGYEFGRSVSGHGLDVLFGKKVANKSRNNIAIIDDLVADHSKPIDDTNGAFYNYLSSNLINPKAEFWYLINNECLDRSICEI